MGEHEKKMIAVQTIEKLKTHMQRHGYRPDDPTDSETELVHEMTQFTFSCLRNEEFSEICLYRTSEDLLISYDIPSGRIESERFKIVPGSNKKREQWKKDLQREIKRLDLSQYKEG